MAPQQPSGEINYLNICIPTDASAQKIEILTKIRQLEQRIIKVPCWSIKEIITLLEGARDAAMIGNDIEIANQLLVQANNEFRNNSQIKNRNWYAISIVLGVLLALLVCAIIPALPKEWTENLTDVSTITSLVFFAVLGSATSIFTRLPDLDFRDESSKKYVIYSAISRPFVAIAFASIVYIILKNQFIPIQFKSDDSKEATYWLAAFLCGFSERFAPELLNKISKSTFINK